MATTADSATNVSPAWAQVVRGVTGLGSAVHPSPMSLSQPLSPPPIASSSEQVSFYDCSPSKPASSSTFSCSSSSPPPDSPVAAECTDSNNSATVRPKKQAWNKTVNGVVDVGPLMGADSWPALSKSETNSPKLAGDFTSKDASDGLVSTPQGHGSHNLTQRQATSNASQNSVPNRGAHGRQRSSKRGAGNTSVGGAEQSTLSRPPAPTMLPTFPILHMPPNGYGAFVPVVPDPLREPQYRGNNLEGRTVGPYVSHSHSGNDQWHSSRRSNNGQRGDGGYLNNFGGRGRGRTRGYVRPPPASAHTFVPPIPVTAYVNPLGYVQDYVYISPYRLEPMAPMPLVPPPSPSAVVVPRPDHLLTGLVNQIEYYFSDANLVKDNYLKSNMDEEGWVPISLIAGFPRIRILTNDTDWILDSLRSSSVVVEVQGDKVRRRNDWMRWIASCQVTVDHSGPSRHTESSSDTERLVAASFGRMSMEEGTTGPSSGGESRPHSDGTLGPHSFELNEENAEAPSLR